MIPDAFAAPGRFYRGNLHTHSNVSDGALDPAEVCRRYHAEGYDFISLTDHFIGQYGYPITDISAFRGDGFTTIPGAELHSGASENGELWHILAVGLPADFAPPDAPHFLPVPGQESGPDLARRARDAGAFVAVAHPHWTGLSLSDVLSIEAAHAIEVYNHISVVNCGRGQSLHIADLALAAGRRVGLIACDDAHFTCNDHFGGWVMVKATQNSPDALLAALKAGHYYATQGPEFAHVEITGDRVLVRCSAVESVIVQGIGSPTEAVHGAALTRAEVPLAALSASPYLRLTLRDRAGREAWSNPIWRD